MVIDPWVLLGLLVFSATVTLATNWLAARIRRLPWPATWSLAAILASLIWIAIIFAAGMVATRYIERITNAAIGYLAFGFVAFLLSLVRALLYRRVQEQQELRPEPQPDRRELLYCSLHNLTYLLFAIILYLILSLSLHRPADPLLFIPLGIGALLPDLDSSGSPLGRLLPFISRRLEACLGHRQAWHTPAVAALIALVSAPLILLIGVQVWFLIPFGFVAHLILDMLRPQGIMLFWPLTHTHYLVGGFIESPGDLAERKLTAALAIIALALLFFVDLGPPPPPPAVTLSYEQSLEQYYALRGRSLVFADVEGTWQATGRRATARFEILNAAGQTLIMHDRYAGKVFSAGRSAADNLYLNSITLRPGSSAHIKPVEVHLQDQRLSEALPVVYEMQREPGLQHIFVSGDVLIPTVQAVVSPTLQADYAQTRLRKVQAHDPGHYSFHYLTASELVGLANLHIENADLIIVATYASPASGPTVTPLPSLPTTPGATP